MQSTKLPTHRSNLAALLFLVATSAFIARCAVAEEMHALKGHVPSAVTQLAPISRVPAASSLNLAIGLPLRNQGALSNLLHDLYDPYSPRYHQYLTHAEFTEQFGPTEKDYQDVINFATSHGLKVTGTHSSRVILDVSGSVADVEKAFQIGMNVYQHPKEQRTFFAPSSEPLVPTSLPILDIEGLNNYVVPHPLFHLKEPTDPKTNGIDNVGTGPSGLGYISSDLRTAYAQGLTNTGAGQAIALVEFAGFYPKDISTYETDAHISTNIPITKVLLNGFNGAPTSGGNSGTVEVDLDIEMAVGIAPGISNVFVYEEAYDTNVAIVNDLLDQIATDDTAKQISCSWVIYFNGSTDAIFQTYAAQGQSFYNASGDSGAYVGEISPAADDPYITQVGGTTLTTSGAGGPWSSETTWQEGGGSASSGGVSPLYTIPAWQQGFNMTLNKGSQTQRNTPDVAAIANQVFFVYNNGTPSSVGGTSCAAPLWAGLTALINQKAVASGMNTVGFINPALYNIALSSAYGSNFHDITSGNNTNDYVFSEFSAGTGYDLCTGIGTPIGNTLMNTLLAAPDALQITPNYGFTSTGPQGGPFNITSQTYLLTNTGNVSLNWNTGTKPIWITITPSSGTLAAHTATSVTVSLNGKANIIVAGADTGTISFTNLTSHLGQIRQFAVKIGQPLVTNGGFETGDFAYWLLANDNGYYNFVGDSSTGITPHSGTYSALLGQPGLPLGTLTQTIGTFPGQPYLISFWWENPDIGGTNFPNEFSVSWDGNVLFDQVDLPIENDWTNFQFLVAASGTSSTLQFGFRSDFSDFGLDDVSVTSFPQPAFTGVTETNQTINLTWSAVTGYNYEVQYSTDLTQTNWITLGGMIQATASTMTTTDPSPTDVARFYRIVLIL